MPIVVLPFLPYCYTLLVRLNISLCLLHVHTINTYFFLFSLHFVFKSRYNFSMSAECISPNVLNVIVLQFSLLTSQLQTNLHTYTFNIFLFFFRIVLLCQTLAKKQNKQNKLNATDCKNERVSEDLENENEFV